MSPYRQQSWIRLYLQKCAKSATFVFIGIRWLIDYVLFARGIRVRSDFLLVLVLPLFCSSHHTGFWQPRISAVLSSIMGRRMRE